MASAGAESDCGCKLGRVAAQRGVESALASLENDWRDDRVSLRELAATFNQRLLAAALESNGHAPLEGEPANLYHLLEADEVSAGMRVQARNRLEEHGVDVDQLAADFVSYQTVNRHLKDCRGFSADRRAGLELADGRDRLFALRNRAEAVTDRTVTQLVDSGELELGTIEVHVGIGVTCTECGRQLDLADLFARRGCECRGL